MLYQRGKIFRSEASSWTQSARDVEPYRRLSTLCSIADSQEMFGITGHGTLPWTYLRYLPSSKSSKLRTIWSCYHRLAYWEIHFLGCVGQSGLHEIISFLRIDMPLQHLQHWRQFWLRKNGNQCNQIALVLVLRWYYHHHRSSQTALIWCSVTPMHRGNQISKRRA